MSAAGQTVDRREILAQQLDKLEANPESTVETTSQPEPVVTEGTKPERDRDESGKFVAKDKTQPELPLEASAAPSAAPAPVVEPPLWDRPPASWNKKTDLHEPWKNVDPKIREMVWQREQQMNEGVMPLKEKAKLADAINEVAQPYMNTIRGMGVDLPQAVRGLMEVDHELRNGAPQQKLDRFLRLATYYGIDLTSAQNMQQPGPGFDLQTIHHELNNIRGEVKSWQQQQQEAAAATQLAEINKFALKAEFFEEARPTMVQLLQSGVATDIEDAYHKAIRLDEDLSGKVAARTQAQTLATQSAAADKAAKAAKLAAVSVKTSTPGASTTTKAQDRRAMLEEAFSNIDGRL